MPKYEPKGRTYIILRSFLYLYLPLGLCSDSLISLVYVVALKYLILQYLAPKRGIKIRGKEVANSLILLNLL